MCSRHYGHAQLRTTLAIILLIILLRQISFGIAQQTEPCSYNAALTVANCSARQLEHVPSTLHKSIITLDLSSNNFSTLANQSFISYKYINTLYLKNCSIVTVGVKAFHSLNFLNNLDLSNNKLSLIPALALEIVARSLLKLSLSGNTIQIVPRGVFGNFTELQLLDLGGNSIYRVEHGAFKGLKSMLEFKIRHNSLKFLPQDSFDDFPEGITKVQLYDNRWECDCKIRWLRGWLNKTSESVWETSGYKIRCDSPSIVHDKPLDSLPMDELACEIQMKTSSSTRELARGVNTTLFCKYYSVPLAEAKWLRNSEVINVQRNYQKYSVETQILDGHTEQTQQSELRIRDFSYEDIARYSCFVQNFRGFASTEYKLTLEGVPFDSVTPAPSVDETSRSLDTRSIVIAVAVVCGIILLIAVGLLIFYSVNRVQRKRQAKQDAIVENVKQHFINNSEVTVSNGNITGIGDGMQISKSMEDKLSQVNDDSRSNSNNTNDSNITAVKRPLDLEYLEQNNTFGQPESPVNNGNTYVSFGSELTDPGEFSVPPIQYTRTPSSRYESSHAGSVTPLLERYTPSVFDSDEPIEDYAHYPVYDSLTNTLQHPHMENIYRNGSTSGYSSYRSNDAAKRLSGFHYQPNGNESMPETPGSIRSAATMAQRYTDMDVDGHFPSDLYHTTPRNHTDYQNYNDMRYPTTTPPPQRMTPSTKKSMSVGNLGYTSLTLGPRKPPRVFQSREYMELTPQEGSEDYIASPEAQTYSQNYGITPGTPV